jgi:outer membrane usher protein
MTRPSASSHNQRLKTLRRKRLARGLGSALFAPGLSLAAASGAAPVEAQFETNFLSASSQVDMSRFGKGNVILADTYRVDIIVNQDWKGREDVVFKDVPGNTSAVPCLSTATLSKWGVDFAKVARGDGKRSAEEVAAHTITSTELCGDIGKYIPDASLNFDEGTQALSITVPQLYMDNRARGYVDPSQWDKGINAGILAYNFASSHTGGPRSSTQSYLGLNAGVNLGDWHLRHQGSLQFNSNGRNSYQNTATYVQRDIPSLKAQLILGDSFTSGQIADSFRVRGVNVSSDPRMYPQSQQGYAPTVRGVADSNARVSIRQNGYVIYETTVAPGPFEINDLFATGYGGDLEVTVTESDGRKNTFFVPFTAVPQLLRPGQTQFSAVAGQLQQYGTGGSTPWVMQATVQRGINNTFTGFGGVTASQGYAQINGGTAINTRYGAVALNLAASQTQLPGGESMHGQSLGLTFSKNLTQTGTNLSLGAYRYSTSGYLSLLDAVSMRQLARDDRGTASYARQRSRLDLNISQKVGDKSSLYLAGSTTDYWGSGNGRQTSYSAGFSSQYRSVSWGVSAERTRTQPSSYRDPIREQAEAVEDIFYGSGYVRPGITDNRIMFTLSMPLGTAPKAPSFNSYVTRNTGSNASTGVQLGLSGTSGSANQITYGVSANHNAGRTSSDYFNANLGYQASTVSVRGGYSRSGDINQVSVSGNGGIVVHEGGVQFAQQLGDTIGLVEAKGAKGASVSGATGVSVGSNGYAVVPYLMPYQLNTISIDPKGASDDVDLKETSVTNAPRLGAVVKLKYETETGRAVIIKALRANGEPLPFAAEVLDEQGNNVGVVGQASKLFVRGIPDQGSLLVKWGDTPDSQCRVAYRLPPQATGQKQQSATVVQGQCLVPSESASASTQQALRHDGVSTSMQPAITYSSDSAVHIGTAKLSSDVWTPNGTTSSADAPLTY